MQVVFLAHHMKYFKCFHYFYFNKPHTSRKDHTTEMSHWHTLAHSLALSFRTLWIPQAVNTQQVFLFQQNPEEPGCSSFCCLSQYPLDFHFQTSYTKPLSQFNVYIIKYSNYYTQEKLKDYFILQRMEWEIKIYVFINRQYL